MSKFFTRLLFVFLSLSSLSFLSCTSTNETARKPVGPTTDESDMPWNRPTGPEGAGALGVLDQR